MKFIENHESSVFVASHFEPMCILVDELIDLEIFLFCNPYAVLTLVADPCHFLYPAQMRAKPKINRASLLPNIKMCGRNKTVR